MEESRYQTSRDSRRAFVTYWSTFSPFSLHPSLRQTIHEIEDNNRLKYRTMEFLIRSFNPLSASSRGNHLSVARPIRGAIRRLITRIPTQRFISNSKNRRCVVATSKNRPPALRLDPTKFKYARATVRVFSEEIKPRAALSGLVIVVTPKIAVPRACTPTNSVGSMSSDPDGKRNAARIGLRIFSERFTVYETPRTLGKRRKRIFSYR